MCVCVCVCVCVCEGISSWGVRNSRGGSRARFITATVWAVRWKVKEGSSPGDCDNTKSDNGEERERERGTEMNVQ